LDALIFKTVNFKSCWFALKYMSYPKNSNRKGERSNHWWLSVMHCIVFNLSEKTMPPVSYETLLLLGSRFSSSDSAERFNIH
jgi:hypothetical protein